MIRRSTKTFKDFLKESNGRRGRMLKESRDSRHYSEDTFYIKRKEPDYGIYKVEIGQDDLGLEDVIGDIDKDWIPCTKLGSSSSRVLDEYFNNSDTEDVVRKALESDSSGKKLYTIDWNVRTAQPWIDYDEVDLSSPDYEEFVNDFKNDGYADDDAFDGNAIAFCDEESIKSIVGTIQKYMESGSCYYNIEKMELDTDEESLIESDDVSNNDSCGGFIDDGESVVDGIVGNWGDYDEIDEEDAIKELQDKADYAREEDDGMRESVMRSRRPRGRMIRESRRPRGRMLRESRLRRLDEVRRADGRNFNWAIRKLPVAIDADGNIETPRNVRYVGELTPNDGRTSFYGKATIYMDDKGNEYLKSYDTFVAKRTKDGETYLLIDPVEDDWAFTATTARHIRSFQDGSDELRGRAGRSTDSRIERRKSPRSYKVADHYAWY